MEENVMKTLTLIVILLLLISSITAIASLTSTGFCLKYSVVRYMVKQVYVIKYHGVRTFNTSDLMLNLFSIPLNFTQKILYEVYVNGTKVKVDEVNINGTLYVKVPSVILDKQSSVNYTLTFIIDVINAENRYPDYGSIAQYFNETILTESTKLWNFSHPIISSVIKEEKFKNLKDIVEWFHYLKKKGLLKYKTHMPPLYPWEVLKKGEGDCDEQANLFITIARGINIPTFLQYGIVYIENYTYSLTVNDVYEYVLVNTGWHGWVIAYDENIDAWIPIDMTIYIRSENLPEYAGGAVMLNRTIIWGNIVMGDYIGEFNKFIEELKKYNVTVKEYDETRKLGSWYYSEHICLSDFVPTFLCLQVVSIFYIWYMGRKRELL